MMKRTQIGFIIVMVSIISSCKLFDPDELVPSYIYLDDIRLNPKSNEGTSSDKIIDAWVYVNGNQVGIFELPSRIPIHVEGSYTLQIFPGIKKNGLTAVRVRNDFMTSFDTTLNSIPNNLDTVRPAVEYKSDIDIWIEDFEDPGVKFSKLSYSDTDLQITNLSSEVFEGNGSGKIEFESSFILFEAKTNELDFNSFPKGGRPVYIELNYKSNEVLTIGVYHNNTSTTAVKEEFLNLLPTDGVWEKTYINVADLVSTKLAATEFDIYLEVKKNRSSLPLVFVDNIKVIF